MFVCGPTVYDLIHIGNARTFVFFDAFSKYLRSKGLAVEYLQNITDIDDKIITKAKTERKSAKDIAENYEKEFMADMNALGVTGVTRYARATDHIPQVIEQVKKLRDKGHAYQTKDGWYFDVKPLDGYGKLSGRTAEMAEDGVSRIDDGVGKRNKADFALWKHPNSAPPPDSSGNANALMRMIDGEPAWYSEELGWGRPGWHVEDTAITEHYFGPQYDIHGGGQDLMFPHHEAEIAQQESASGKAPFVNYWVHVAFLINKGQKMAKSVGNFTTVRRLTEQYSKEIIRQYLFSADHRSPLEYSEEIMESFRFAQDNLKKTLRRMAVYSERGAFNVDAPGSSDRLSAISAEISAALEDNFNTASAIGLFNSMVALVNQLIDEKKFDAKAYDVFTSTLDSVNAALASSPAPRQFDVPSDIAALMRRREEARAAVDWPGADAIRKELESRGYTIDDTPYGPILSEK